MKKTLLSLTTVCILFFVSCKKDSNSNSGNQQPTINANDPVALSKSIKIWHATRATGIAPAPAGGLDAPAVESPSDNVHALAGSFAVIKPTVLSGNIAGYYIGIEGAGEYFKLDYSKPRNAGRPIGKKPRAFLQRPLDGIDSSIVVAIPANLQVPDTFCISYCPYDSLGNIGQPVTTCIIVSQLGGDAAASWVNGTWQYAGDFDFTANTFDTLIYGRWISSLRENVSYYCYSDMFGNTSITQQVSNLSDPNYTLLNVRDSVFRFAGDLSLGGNGGMTYLDSSVYKNIRIDSSTCNNWLFNSEQDVYHVTGGWSVTGNRMTLVYLFDEFGLEDYSAEEYIVDRPDNNTLILRFDDGSNEGVLLKRL